MDKYDPQAIEAKWQQAWEAEGAFSVPNPGADEDGAANNAYVLEMLPYPSGDLHMGHVLNYTLGDVITHFRRRSGYSVLRPMGYDSFGLPAENAAIRQGGHPRETTERSITNIRRQMRRMGWAIDWERELSTHEPEYYRWTQWLFLKLLEADLAYRKEAAVKWCPNDQTVLANEQVVDGHCERCGALVEAKKLEQWFFKTTLYADRLLNEMAEVEYWPERIIAIQRNWIGRSEGAEIVFRIAELDIDVPVFTTRPDTLFGGTFAVFAPEQDLVPRLVEGTPHEQEVLDYVRRTAAESTVERTNPDKEKTGVFTGRYATNPATNEQIPIWVSDYVLAEYGTGAIMAVPAHDERDFEFAQRFGLPVRTVVVPAEGDGEVVAEGAYVAHSENERLVNSAQFSGMPAPEGGGAIVEWLEERHAARFAVSFRLRDWGFSRQRYWGCPIPVVYCGSCGIVPVPEDELPVLLPDIEDYSPRGRPPLATAEDWVSVPCPRCGGEGRREVETMDTFVDSSWYFLRYCDPHNEQAPFDRKLVDYWLPVDQYIGGAEHATMHLLYARFFVKVLNDLGLLGFREPFMRLFNQGSINYHGARMSKSRGNVVPPDETVGRYGADALRLYILFMGPVDQDKEWQDTGIEGMVRFLNRLWRVVHEVAGGAGDGRAAAAEEGELVRKAHETIARASDDIGRRFVFNTPISAVMELMNELGRDTSAPGARFAAETAVSLIQPYAPHVAEELWSVLGHERLWEQPWPVADESKLARRTFELVIQVNGRVRDRVEASVDESEAELVERALASTRVQAHVDGKQVRQTIVVPGRLVNLVV